MKTCIKCGETKKITAFSNNSAKRDGIDTRCKACRRSYSAAWHAARSADIRERTAARRAAYRVANKDGIAARNAANKGSKAAYDAARHAANPEANRIKWQNRRARKRESGGTLSKGLAERLFQLQRGKCACGCKQPLGDNYHRDHIIPLALGGTNTDDNMQLLTATCNLSKGAKHPIDFMQSRGYLL